MTHAQGTGGGVGGAYRNFAGCPNLVMDLRIDAALGVWGLDGEYQGMYFKLFLLC